MRKNRLSLIARGILFTVALLPASPRFWADDHRPAGATATGGDVKAADVKAADVKLSDYRGRLWQLSDFENSKVVVIAFLGVECPLAKLYSQRLSEFDAEFSDDDVAFIGVDANPQDSLAELAAHAQRHKIEFPLLRDGEQKLAGALGATRTPEVFVLDRQRRVQYHGRIDDQYGIGYVRERPQSHALRDAIESLLADRAVLVEHEPAVGCLIGKLKPATNTGPATITYSKHIAPIFRDACVQCHREGEIAPFPLTDYAEISGWAETIAEVVAEQRMPPWHANPAYGEFANDCSLSDAQRDTVLAWVAQGAPEGDPADSPPPRTYVSGWQLPREPDLVVEMSTKPFEVPATGEVKYQYFRVDPGFQEDKWVSAAQIVPGNRSVVHHVLVFARPGGSKTSLGAERGFLFGYVPGSLAQPYPEGVAKRIAAGSELIFQVHYTPIGSKQTDQSRIGFIFADPTTIHHEVVTSSAVQTRLNIPPGESDYKTSAMLPETLPECELLGMSPHMHLRGKAFRYTSVGADDSRQILLDVPRYDFNWQTGYRLKQPLKLAAGSKLFCEATFDNSAANLNNPDPKSWVRWGDQTTDEMMIGYFDIMVPRGQRTIERTALSKRSELLRRIDADDTFRSLDADRNDRIERNEVPQRWKNQFELLDVNRDGEITRDELREKSPN
jgi:peroxiredoxin/mono/diheme cytochrome c family protein